jgi:natural product precursor
MKVKRFNKKLVLNKKTIADLSNDEMNALHGGESLPCTILAPTCVVPTEGKCGPTIASMCCAQC